MGEFIDPFHRAYKDIDLNPAPSVMETSALYPRLMGRAWGSVDESVRSIHFDGTQTLLTGRFDVQTSRTRLGRFVCALGRLPTASGTIQGELLIAGSPTCERWDRSFGQWRFASHQIAENGFLIERVGPIDLRFVLSAEGGGIRFNQVAAYFRLLGLRVPIPRCLAPTIAAQERPAPDGRSVLVYVTLGIPVLGALVTYHGEVRRSST